MTKAETELVERVWAMHSGEEERVVRHSLPANRLSTPLGLTRKINHKLAGTIHLFPMIDHQIEAESVLGLIRKALCKLRM